MLEKINCCWEHFWNYEKLKIRIFPRFLKWKGKKKLVVLTAGSRKGNWGKRNLLT